MERVRRLPSKEKSIKEISEQDFRVRVLGTVIDRDEVNNSAMIDDGTGRIAALFADPEQLAIAREGKLVRVIGKVRKDENAIEVEIIQDMGKLDTGLYEQVKYISEKMKRGV
ncbi:MAG: hypothetical protein QME59_00795 [Candidatus Hydrothermarchaeota archaeon]|nr:hypothetical protein [Candidatus Hydrothermarchaeota archaeon]